jgi:mannose/cellobiose epimerase-like protein (N-acyl-D-glucosamine 2-epimerase family)
VQAEALCAWARLHRLECGGSDRYRRALAGQWRFILDNMVDARHGGWFERTSRRGFRRRPLAKAHPWKACYHTTRALLEAARALREYPF